jgi:hypothetical protein
MRPRPIDWRRGDEDIPKIRQLLLTLAQHHPLSVESEPTVAQEREVRRMQSVRVQVECRHRRTVAPTAYANQQEEQPGTGTPRRGSEPDWEEAPASHGDARKGQ